jgi:hypothetical protein
MGEFKGTKGELELKYVSGICIGIGTIGDYSQITANTILPDTDEEYEKEKEEILSNMKLYAAAFEMFLALKSIVEYWDNPQKGSLNDHVEHSLKIAELAIKKAIE